MVKITEIVGCSNDGCTNEASSSSSGSSVGGRYCSPKCRQRHSSSGGGGVSISGAASSSAVPATPEPVAAPTAPPRIPSTEQRSAPTAMQSMCRQLADIAARELVESIAASSSEAEKGGSNRSKRTEKASVAIRLSKSTQNVFGIQAPPPTHSEGDDDDDDDERRQKSQSQSVRDLPTAQLIFHVYSEIYHQRLYYAIRESADAYAAAPRKFEAELVRAVTSARLPETFVEWCGRLADDEGYFRKGHCLEMKRRGLLGKDDTVVNAESDDHWEMMARFRTYRAP